LYYNHHYEKKLKWTGTRRYEFTMYNAAVMHVEIPRRRDATELNNDGSIHN